MRMLVGRCLCVLVALPSPVRAESYGAGCDHRAPYPEHRSDVPAPPTVPGTGAVAASRLLPSASSSRTRHPAPPAPPVTCAFRAAAAAALRSATPSRWHAMSGVLATETRGAQCDTCGRQNIAPVGRSCAPPSPGERGARPNLRRTVAPTQPSVNAVRDHRFHARGARRRSALLRWLSPVLAVPSFARCHRRHPVGQQLPPR
jgi:hypothetical protein